MQSSNKINQRCFTHFWNLCLGFILLLIVAGLLAGCSVEQTNQKTGRAVEPEPATAFTGLQPAPPPGGQEYWGGVLVTLEEAQAMLPFTLLVPAVPPAGGELISVEVALPEDPRAVTLRYSNGIRIHISNLGGSDSDASSLDRVQNVIDSSADGIFHLTDVNGIAAGGADPGSDRSTIMERDIPRQGVIFWFDGPVDYAIHGDLPMQELRKIAESMVPYKP